MSTKKKKVIISVKPNGKKQNKNKKPHPFEKTIWDIYSYQFRGREGGINE